MFKGFFKTDNNNVNKKPVKKRSKDNHLPLINASKEDDYLHEEDLYLAEMKHLSSNIIKHMILLPSAIKSQLFIERLIISIDILHDVSKIGPKGGYRQELYPFSNWDKRRGEFFIEGAGDATLHAHLDRKSKDNIDIFDLETIERDVMNLAYMYLNAQKEHPDIFQEPSDPQGLYELYNQKSIKLVIMYSDCILDIIDFFKELSSSIFSNSFLYIHEHECLHQRDRVMNSICIWRDSSLFDIFSQRYIPSWDTSWNFIGFAGISSLKNRGILDEASSLLASGTPPPGTKPLPTSGNERQISDSKDDNEIIYPSAIIEHLNINVIGQNNAKTALANAVFTHQTKIISSDDMPLPSSNLLLVGPSGSGKTHLITELSELIDVPHVVVDAQSFTGTGWNGKNTSDIFESLLKKASGCLEKAQMGIVFIDEIDKLANSSDPQSKHNTTEVQGNLLRAIESSEVSLSDDVIMSTENILFIFAGAFSGLDEIIRKRTNIKSGSKMGFTSSSILNKDSGESTSLLEVKAEDLINYGLMPEFVGRMRNITSLEALSDNDMMAVFKTPKSIVNQYKNLFSSHGTKLKFDTDAMLQIIASVSEKKLGVRAVEAEIANILQYYVSEITQKGNEDIVISKAQVLFGY